MNQFDRERNDKTLGFGFHCEITANLIGKSADQVHPEAATALARRLNMQWLSIIGNRKLSR